MGESSKASDSPDALSDYFKTLFDSQDALSDYFKTLSDSLDALSDYFKTLSDSLDALSDYFKALSEICSHRYVKESKVLKKWPGTLLHWTCLLVLSEQILSPLNNY